MSTKVTIEVDVKHEAIVRRALAMAEEMEQLALSAPDGTVFDACEGAVVDEWAEVSKDQVLAEAVTRTNPRLPVPKKGGADPRLYVRTQEGKPRAQRTAPDDGCR